MESFKKSCPSCGLSVLYSSKNALKLSIRKNSVCRKCASTGENNGMYGKTAEKNPFFGKHHTQKTISVLKKVDKSYTKTDDFKKKLSVLNKGVNNSMFGLTVYDLWVKKYGVDVANEKLKITKLKHSKNNSGSGNPMYGKPSPTGSGNGWSGWYKGWYFRSLKELTYMVKVIERFKLKWENGESAKFKITYLDYNGNKRNYYPDFIVNDKYVIEIKPKKLWNSDSVLRKKEATIKHCETKGLKYKLVDVTTITDEEIRLLRDTKQLVFLDRYENKFLRLFGE